MKTEVEVALEEAEKAAADALEYGNGFIMWDICTMRARHIPWQDVQRLEASPEQQAEKP